MLPHTYVRHRTAEGLVKAFMGRRRTYADPIGDVHTRRQWLALVRRHGYWAYVRVRRSRATIHWWADPSVPDEDVGHMLGHELGHISGERLEDLIHEELRADAYGDVTREVMGILRTRPRPAPAGRRRGRPSARRSRRASARAER